MAPTAIYDTVFGRPGPANDLPPPKLYPVREVKFEKPVPVHTDGREKALQQTDGSAAIIIDNGALRPSFLPPWPPLPVRLHNLTLSNHYSPTHQAPPQSAQDGPSRAPPASTSHRSWLGTATASWARPSRSRATTASRTRRRGATSETRSRPAPASSPTGTSWSTCLTTAS